MLPNRFSLTQKAEERLKRDKLRSGVSPNISARELFFISIEKGAITEPPKEITFGKMTLDKTIWLGELETATEAILEKLYGKISCNEAARKWALHVEDAIS